MYMTDEPPVLGIVCGGTPVPGLNGIIAASTRYAKRVGWKVLAFNDGYVHLATGDPQIVLQHTIELTKELVKKIASLGGSIIHTDRFDPTRNPQWVHNVNMMLEHFKVRYLLVIGGNDKIRSAHIMTQGVDPYHMQVLVIPKTIDNDIDLPVGQSSFGYHSARKFATRLVKGLIQDAHAVPRWFVVEIISKCTGHLPLSVAGASGAHLAIIPEDFGNRRITMNDILDVFEGAIYKRLAMGKNYGVCIVSQGLLSQMAASSLQTLFPDGIPYRSDGQIDIDEIDFSRAIRLAMTERLKAKGIPIRLNNTKMGYELRGCKPVAFDEIYSQELGFAAIEGFRTRHSNALIVWENGKISFRSFRAMMDSAGRINIRKVDINSEDYKISRSYMWQLNQDDINDSSKLEKLAEAAKLEPEEFQKKFKRIIGITPQ